MSASANLAILILTGLTLSVCLFAILKGGPAERRGAILILFMLAVGRSLKLVSPAEIRPLVDLSSDAVLAVGLLLLTLQFGSPWLGVTMLFYAAQFTLHSFYLVTARPEDSFHDLVNNGNFLAIHLSLIVGTVMSWRQRRRLAAA
jgi:hypothetical protein